MLTDSSACPHCGKQLQFGTPALYNVHTYRESAIAISECCGRAFRLSAVTKIVVEPYQGSKTEDAWGNPIKKD